MFAEFDPSIRTDDCVQIVTDAATILLPLSDIIDVAREKARLEAEKARMEGEIARVSAKLANEGFVAKAPSAVVDAERAKLAKYKENLAGIEAAYDKLK